MEDGPIVVSHSRIGTFAACGEKYRRRYILGEKGAPALPLVFGSAFHACAAMVNRRGGHASQSELEDIADEKWAEAGAELALLKVVEPDLNLAGERVLLGKMLQAWHDAPGRQVPQNTEVERVVPLRNPKTGETVPLTFLKFIIDEEYSLTPGGGCVGEIKTSGNRWGTERILTELQASTYLLGLGVPALDVIYTIVTKREAPTVQRFKLALGPDDAQEAFDRIIAALAGIRAGAFPKNRGPLCSSCDYQEPCIGLKERWNNVKLEL